MKLNLYTVGTYQIIKIEEDLNIIADLHELYYIVEGYVNRDLTNIAVSFANANYVYSGALAVLLKCLKKIKAKKGDLCIIEPSPDIRNIFISLGLDRLIPLHTSEDVLLTIDHDTYLLNKIAPRQE
ncbi:MAG: STAS domain-containing protein [Chitinivibrionales bacterium]|nr:STAS domain-containing protein [Chitinivibrionales bacterium]